MGKPNFYGRRLLRWQDGTKTIYTKSGQWVGHKYGSDTGTEKQRKNAAPSKTAELIGISTKIFWGMAGSSGELVTDKDLIASCSFS